MNPDAFDHAFRNHITDVAEACTGCGACFDVCPITSHAGLEGQQGDRITLDIRRLLKGEKPEDQQAYIWASTCVLSGDCIDACEHGVNPRLMLTMARMVSSETHKPDVVRKEQGLGAFKKLGVDVKTLSRMQLTQEDLMRLGQGASKSQSRGGQEAGPEYVFYTGCNVLKTPHIALLCLDILDALGKTYVVLGGPSHCCGILQFRAGDMETSMKVGTNSIEKFQETGASEVLSWCPTCQVQFDEIALPTYRAAVSSDPFNMTPFVFFLLGQLDRLRPLMVRSVEMRVALHLHPGVRGLPEAAKELLKHVPGLDVVDLGVSEVGLMSNALSTLPEYKRDLQRLELEAAQAAGVDALAGVYHADHRELCAHEDAWPFRIINFLELIAAAMGIVRTDTFKSLKLKQDADAILEDCMPLMLENRINPVQARSVIENALLGEQPLALRCLS